MRRCYGDDSMVRRCYGDDSMVRRFFGGPVLWGVIKESLGELLCENFM